MANVLIVDDARLMRRMLADILEEAGYDVVGQAEDGDGAVELARSLTPDIITMDVIMPQQNGVEATKAIRAFLPKARILIISAVGQESLVREALDAGADNYILKPLQKSEVLAAIAGF